ncbi:MAG: MarR family winged helix-turn-helix transcriptional regulator [Acidimicrobiales bacterium]
MEAKVLADSASVSAVASASSAGEAQRMAGRLRLALTRLARQLRRHDPSNLTIAQLSALATVVASGPLGVGQLAEAEILPSPAATRLADKLEEAGFVERQVNPADRRGVLLVATPAGVELVARRERAGNAWLAARLEALSEPDRAALERAIKLLEAMASEHVEKELQR